MNKILDPLAPQIYGAVTHDTEWLVDQKIQFMRGSINDRSTVEEALEGVTQIVHLVAETGTGQSMHEMARYNEFNTQGTAVFWISVMTH